VLLPSASVFPETITSAFCRE